MPVPRRIAGSASLNSLHLSMRPETLFVNTSRCSLRSRFTMISAKPKSPIATTTKPMPSDSSAMPNE